MKKRILSLALALVLAVSLLPGTKAEAAGSATGQQIVNCAMQYLGKVPYVWGGTNIDGSNPGADCSGFICRIYEKFGFNFWANRTKLRNCGTNLGTDLSVAQLGDIIWFDGHVAIYAGKSNGSHMIVHETGGDFQNVVYTKVSVVKAELKGIIRIPGVTNSGSIGPEPAPNVKFALPTNGTYTAKQKITNTNAVVVNQITKPSGVRVTKMGVILCDASGTQIKKYSENVSNVANSTTTYHSWYDINAEVGVTLTPGTTYKYQFFGVFDGAEVKGGTYSFTTTGTAPVKIFSATFRLNEDGSAVAIRSVTQGKAYGDLPTPYAREGYTFDGWYTAATGGTKITATTVFNGSADITLYPHYTANPVETVEAVTIHYYKDGREVITQTTVIGSTYIRDCYIQEGYTFAGWYSSETGGTRYDGTQITATSPRTLYARYEPVAAQQYTVYLYVNGAVLKTLTVTNGGTYGDLPAPSLSGYTFDGWYTAATGGTKITGSTTVNLTANQTLYAHFTAVTETGIVLQIGNPKMYVNGSARNIDENGTVPVIRNSRTLLPVRAVFEAMGGTVGWDNASRVVSLTKGGKTLYLGIDNALSWDSQGKYYTLDSAPVIINNRTMLPIRFVVEYFGGTVGWDGATQKVTVHY
ncbi:InlB B-repeat-containing protein [Evtepia sp.]|uniref:InlB B-repeat-containing protein n=1 Tax=Evtepia sp. TaxID=2773933 RepID=UPI003F17F878